MNYSLFKTDKKIALGLSMLFFTNLYEYRSKQISKKMVFDAKKINQSKLREEIKASLRIPLINFPYMRIEKTYLIQVEIINKTYSISP